jgi:hypothetical protein
MTHVYFGMVYYVESWILLEEMIEGRGHRERWLIDQASSTRKNQCVPLRDSSRIQKGTRALLKLVQHRSERVVL